MNYTEIILNNGASVLVENASSNTEEGPVEVSVKDDIKKAVIDLSRETEKIAALLSDVSNSIVNNRDIIQPKSIEVEVGIGFDQSVGCVVLGSSLNAQIKLKLTWENKNDK